MPPYLKSLFWALLLGCSFGAGGQGVSSIVTVNETGGASTNSAIPGAGHRNAAGVVSSLWDSTGTSFTMRYGVGSVNRTTISQFTVSGFSGNFIPAGGAPTIRVRRSASEYVGANTVHFNMWMAYDTVPPSGSTGGTFLLKAARPTSDAALLQSGNILAGLDNVFQNTIQNLHAGNIERIDVIISAGLTPVANDITRAGTVVFDRGTGDTFKIAAITGLDGAGNPLSYGPLVTVSHLQFGPNLLAASQTMVIATQDNRILNRPRPSSLSTQNIRGTLVTLGTLGITAGQTFYGYSLFPLDVTSAQTDWNTQPINTNSGNQIDPVAYFGVFKEVGSTLAVRDPLPARVVAARRDGPLLWPNPATETLHVSGLPNRSRVQLLNAAGLLLGTYPLPQGKGVLGVGHLPSGVYFLREEGGGMLKWIKQ